MIYFENVCLKAIIILNINLKKQKNKKQSWNNCCVMVQISVKPMCSPAPAPAAQKYTDDEVGSLVSADLTRQLGLQQSSHRNVVMLVSFSMHQMYQIVKQK